MVLANPTHLLLAPSPPRTQYDKLVAGTTYDWALDSLEKHKPDPRPLTYTRCVLKVGRGGGKGCLYLPMFHILYA